MEVGGRQEQDRRQDDQDHRPLEVLLEADRKGRMQHQQDQGSDGSSHRQAEEEQLGPNRYHQVCLHKK